MPDVILIADDLTGAADSAAPFASLGIPARLVFDRSAAPVSGVTALSTNSRDLDVSAARSAVREACRWTVSAGADSSLLFKKIDSTLRGHPAAELEVVIEQFRADRLLLTPAFPAQGRTTRAGRLLVHGTPLCETTFASEDCTDDLTRHFAGVAGLPVWGYSLDMVRGDFAHLTDQLAMPGIHVPDIDTDADMQRCVEAALAAGVKSFCGAGGLGRALAWQLAPDRADFTCGFHTTGPALIVAGSRNQATLDQVEEARRAGTPVVLLETNKGAWEREVINHLQGGISVIVSSTAASRSYSDPESIRQALGKGVRRIVDQARSGLVVLTGGDVADAVCQALGARTLVLRGEMEPGIPLSTLESGGASGLPVVTKAGGFGDRGAFRRLLESVRRE